MPSRTLEELQAQLGRAITQLRLAGECADALQGDGMSEDIFMIQTEIMRVLSSTRSLNQLKRYQPRLQYVSQNQERLWPSFSPRSRTPSKSSRAGT